MYLSHFPSPVFYDSNLRASTTSERLALQSGLITKTSSGVYALLPLGFRVYSKFRKCIDDIFSAINVTPLELPSLQPISWWINSKRWDLFNEQIMKVTGYHESFCLSPSSEEQITQLIKQFGNISYYQLPFAVSYTGSRFRTGGRAHGLHRAEEYVQHEVYGFASSQSQMLVLHNHFFEAYKRFFSKSKLPFYLGLNNEYMEKKTSNFYIEIPELQSSYVLYCEDCIRIWEDEDFHTRTSCSGMLIEKPCIRTAQTTILGDLFSKNVELTYQSQENENIYIQMCSGGISFYRWLIGYLYYHRDSDGIIWTRDFAPFEVLLISVGENENVIRVCRSLYQSMQNNNIEVLWDDRPVPMYLKMKTAKLLGIPMIIIIGPQKIQNNKADLITRGNAEQLEIDIDFLPCMIEKLLK